MLPAFAAGMLSPGLLLTTGLTNAIVQVVVVVVLLLLLLLLLLLQLPRVGSSYPCCTPLAAINFS